MVTNSILLLDKCFYFMCIRIYNEIKLSLHNLKDD